MSPKYSSRIKHVSFKVPAMTKRTEKNYAVVTNTSGSYNTVTIALLVIFFSFNRRCTKTFLVVYSWIKITLKQHQQLFFLKVRNWPTNNNSALSSLLHLCVYCGSMAQSNIALAVFGGTKSLTESNASVTHRNTKYMEMHCVQRSYYLLPRFWCFTCTWQPAWNTMCKGQSVLNCSNFNTTNLHIIGHLVNIWSSSKTL